MGHCFQKPVRYIMNVNKKICIYSYYRYAFNGMEKDDEVKGRGNSYDFGARMYDSRLGRWLTIDPLAGKYPSISPYVFVANSPIIFIDPDGKDIVIGGKTDVALDDIKSLLPEKYRSLITVSESNEIIFAGYENLPDEIKAFEGVSLVNSLVNSECKYKYVVGDQLTGIDREDNIAYINQPTNAGETKKNPTAQGAILNFSITKRSDVENGGTYNSKPEAGFDGSVLIQDGEFTRANKFTGTGRFPILRNTIVFHELKENQIRTESEKDYVGSDGAHAESGDLGNKFSKEVNDQSDPNAGTATGFIPKK